MVFKSHLFSLILIAAIGTLFLGSCGMKKKSSSSYSYGSIDRSRTSTKTKTPVSDASNARSIEYSGNKLDNYAQLLGVSTRELNTNRNLYYFIDDWMGIPHRLGGLDRNGVDCSAFVGMIYREIFNKNLPRTSRDMADVVKRKYDDQLNEGDLVFFSFGGKNIDHVGIYLHNDKFVHVSNSKGVIISNLKDPWYYKYLKRCGTPNI